MKSTAYDYNKIIYDIGLGVFFSVVAVMLVVKVCSPLKVSLMPCLLHRLTGYYCPGCGGTRAVWYLLHGQWWQSFYHYPLVPVAFVWYAVFMVTYTIERATHGKCRVGVRYHDGWLWFALVLVVANCVIKNLVLYFTGIALIR